MLEGWRPKYQNGGWWVSDADCEEAEAREEARRKQLQMKMIKLSYRDNPDLIRHLLDQLRVPGNDVDGETEEMLTLWITPSGLVLGFRSEPARKLDVRVYSFEDRGPLKQIPVHLKELLKEFIGGGGDVTHVLKLLRTFGSSE